MLRQSLTTGMLLVLLGGVAPRAVLADDKADVRIEVWAIRATTKSTDVSPELREFADVLKKQFKYTGFKLERRERGSAPLNKTFTAKLIADYSVTIKPLERVDDDKIKLEIVVKKKEGKEDVEKLSTKVTIRTGPLLPVGGLPLGGDESLILAVRAR